MENNQKEIIDIALDRLNQEGLWFTTKEDKLYANAKDLYKLDKFGELEDKSKERLIAEVESYLGDGATFIIEAVDQWIEDNLAEGLLGYVDTLAMDFEIPEAVENTNSYSEQGVDNLETAVAKEADKAKKEEGKKIVEDNDRDFDVYQQYIMSNVYCDNETMMTSPEIIEDNAGLIAEDAAKEVVAQIFDGKEPEGIYQATLEDYTEEIKRVILANIDRIVYLQNTEQEELNAKLTEAKADGYSKPVKVDGKWFRYNYKYNELEYITHSSNEFGPIEVIDSIGVDPEDWREDKDLCIQRFLEDIKSEEDVDISEFDSLFPKKLKEISSKVNCMHYAYNEPNVYRYMFTNKKDAEEAKSILGQYGKVEEVDPMEFSEYEDKKDLDKAKACLVVTFNSDVLKECLSKDKVLTEGARRRLNERNEQSASVIDKALQGISEDTSDKESGIIIKTSELFKKLSDRGYDVQVSFDNGESTSSIAIGQQGANVLITITDADQPLRAFISGNLEINDDSLKMIKSIMEVLK